MSALKITDPLALRLLMTDDLYLIDEQVKHSSVVAEPEPQESISFNYSGENNKYLLILVNEENSSILNAADLESLTAILTAKKLELRDVAIVNKHHYPASDFMQLKQFFSCSKLVLFGINPREIGLPDIGNNEVINHENTKVMATYSFKEMLNDIAKKRLFWNEMKQL